MQLLIKGLWVFTLVGGSTLTTFAEIKSTTTSQNRGADASILRDAPLTNEGNATTLTLKSVPPAPPATDFSTRKALLRFDLFPSGLQQGNFTGGQLQLTLAADVTAARTVTIYGLGDDGLHDGSLTVEAWDESQINWFSAPANNVLNADGDDILVGDDPGRAMNLGTLSIPAGAKSGEFFTFTSPALISFLNLDRNYIAGFILTLNDRGGTMVSFVSAEGSTAAAHPKLTISGPVASSRDPFRIQKFFGPEFGEAPTLEIQTEPGRSYQVQYAATLSGPWQNAPGGNITANSFSSTYTDSEGLEQQQRFYRVADRTPPPPREDSQTILTKGINATVDPIVSETQQHTDKELADFDEPGKAPNRIQANPADVADVVIGVISAALDFGEDGTLKQPTLGRILSPLDPTTSLIDIILNATDEFTGFSRIVDGNPQPGAEPGIFVPVINVIAPTIENNIRAVIAPALSYQKSTDEQVAFLNERISRAPGDPAGAVTDIALESPLLIGPVIDVLYNRGGDGYDAIVDGSSDAVGGFIGGPDANKAVAFGNYLIGVAPEVPQAWLHMVPSAGAGLTRYGLGFTAPLFDLPVLQLVRPAVTGAGRALGP